MAYEASPPLFLHKPPETLFTSRSGKTCKRQDSYGIHMGFMAGWLMFVTVNIVLWLMMMDYDMVKKRG